jgi:hypothetical protein
MDDSKRNHDGTVETDKFTSEGERISEQFRSVPSKQVMEWWQKQLTEIQYAYRGVTHILNKVLAERAELIQRDKERQEMCERLVAELAEANAAIGKLQMDLQAVSERQDRAAEWGKAVNKKLGIEPEKGNGK